jgi:hypothetical protein
VSKDYRTPKPPWKWTPASARKAFLPLHLCRPIELEERLEFFEVSIERFQACTFYSNCVHYAGALLWESFTCRYCQLYVAPEDRRK